MAHHKKQCFQIGSSNVTMKKVAMDWRLSREPADCDVLTITEYEELVASKTQFLQNQVSAAIDEIEKKAVWIVGSNKAQS